MPESSISPSLDISDGIGDSPSNFSGAQGRIVPMTFVLLLADARTHNVRGSPANVHYVESLSAPPYGLRSEQERRSGAAEGISILNSCNGDYRVAGRGWNAAEVRRYYTRYEWQWRFHLRGRRTY